MKAKRIHRIARWFALFWAVGVVLVVPNLPLYGTARSSRAGEVLGHSSLLAVNGWWVVYRILAVPLVAVAVSLLPLPVRVRRIVAVGAATLAGLAALVSLMTVGIFLLPTAIALYVSLPGYWENRSTEAARG